MLLRELNNFYVRATKPNRDGVMLIEDVAFSETRVRWEIPLDLEGNVQGNGLIDLSSQPGEGRTYSVPSTNRPKGAGVVAEFLSDRFEAVFGIPSDPEKAAADAAKGGKQADNLAAKAKNFRDQLEAAHRETGSESIAAVLKFYESLDQEPEFLRWDIQEGSNSPSWLVRKVDGGEVKYKDERFAFSVNGKLLIDDPELREFWKAQFQLERTQTEADAKRGICLVTGETDVPISPSHMPKIKGVMGASSMGASLVSFDKFSFRSYGFAQSYNSPVSLAAVEGYTNALNYLVSSERNRFRIGDTTLLFWAGESDDVTDMFSMLFDNPDEETLHRFLTAPFRGEENRGRIAEDTFFSVTIGGNGGRIVIRDWIQIRVLQAVSNFDTWFHDLKIETYRFHENDKVSSLGIFQLAKSTVRDSKDLKPEIALQLYRAALEGTAPSLGIIRAIVRRIAIDLAKDGKSSLGNLSRFSLLKLAVNRNEKEKSKMIDEKLNPEITDEAYNCGRLLAIFEDLQSAAHEYKLTGASVVEKYYGTASSSPNSAFGILWRLHQHHLKKVARSNRGKSEAIKQNIAEICAKFTSVNPPQFPRRFDLQQQGRFALGFYQQIAADRRAREEYRQQKNSEQSTQNETETN